MRISSLKHRQHAALAVLTLGLVVTAVSVRAQAEPMTISIDAGDVFEMTLDANMPQPEYSWILTRDRAFLSAQRTAFFQTRQSMPGTYVLDVSTQDSINRMSDYHAFNLVMRAPSATGTVPTPSQDVLAAVLETEPPAVNGTFPVSTKGSVIKFVTAKSTGQIARYSLDLDGSTDSDGDGNPENDRDNQQTIGEKDGTPLYVYMTPRAGSRKIILTVENAERTQTATAALQAVVTDNPQPSHAMSSSSARVMTHNTLSNIWTETDGLRVRFTPNIDATAQQGRELLYEWNFGDNTRSLLTTPEHTYASPGMYAVTLSVRDIHTAQVLVTANEHVEVLATTIVDSHSSSSMASSEASTTSSVAAGTGTLGSSRIWSFVRVGFIVLFLVGLCVGLFLVFLWLKRKTTGGLQQTLEKMEGALVPNDDDEKNVEVVPLKLNRQSPPEKVVKKEKERKVSEFSSGEAAQPIQDQTGPVPDWLKEAPALQPKAKPAEAPKLEKPMQENIPDWMKEEAPVAATAEIVEPVAAPAAPQPPPPPVNEPGPVPDWLKPPAPVPVTIPAKATPSTPSPPPSPAPPPAPTPKPAPIVSQPVADAVPVPEAAESPAAPAVEDEPIAIIKADSISPSTKDGASDGN